MKKKLLISVLGSLAIVVAAVSVAYAFGTFKASQEGFRQAGESQAGHLTIRVEAGMADANGDFIPDDQYAGGRGGDLSFSITNTSAVPVRVTKIELSNAGCANTACTGITSNKNTDGTFPSLLGTGSCFTYTSFVAPTTFENWPTIAPHGTLQVNGTDNYHLGAGMLHLAYNTLQGCQGATFAVQLNVTAAEAVPNAGTVTQP